VGSAFRPAQVRAVPTPDVAQGAAAALARAALVGSREQTQHALERLEKIDSVLVAAEEPATGLVPAAHDLRNATLDDPRAYLGASRELLEREDLDPALRRRLELARDDDPLALASDRVRDALWIEFATAFNALAEPLGRSIMTAQLAPYRLGRSLVNYALAVYMREALSLQRRQALGHWKEFLAQNPEAPEATRIAPKVRAAQADWSRLQRDRALAVARKALDADKQALALVYADRALRHMPEDSAAAELREEAAERLLELRERQRRSLAAGAGDTAHVLPREQRALALALLAPGGDVAGAARALREADPKGALADEARFAEALAAAEAGETAARWEILGELAERDPSHANMARHAAAVLNDPEQNTWRAFAEARRRGRYERLGWVLLGPFYRGPRDLGLPGPLEWVVEAPSMAESLLGTPMRLINVPWAKQLPSARAAAALARRHLERSPEDPRAHEARGWLEGYERKRGNWMAVLALEERRPDAPLETLAQVREKAARQYLDAALRERSVGMRLGMYRRLGLVYPGSRAARVAGELARTEADEATAQRIRLSRGFLAENPEVAGPQGLGLRPELLDGEAANAELHPHGVTLLGARVVEVAYLAESGDADDPPRLVREVLGEQHLARVVSQLEETTYRNMLVDPLDELAPDSRRDLYLERARLGLASPDGRSESISQYVYQGVRERYGMVRSRESVLPFDLVVQGDLQGLSLGAFPRMRMPRETPDALLYR
jgi:hypothetical protein